MKEVPIIFIAGLARSGTTLLQSILSKSPSIFTFPETHYFELINELNLWEARIGTREFDELGQLLIKRLGVDSESWALIQNEIITDKRTPNLSERDLFLYLVENYRHAQKLESNKIPLEKTPGHVFMMDRIIQLFPKSKVILMRRNPRDFANSIMDCYWAPNSINEIGRLWADTIKKIDVLRSKYINHIMVVDYEDLIDNPDSTVNQIFDFIGVSFRRQYLDNLSENVGLYILEEEKKWKIHNVTQNIIIKTKKPISLNLVDRIRLFGKVFPSVLRHYENLTRFKI